MSEKGNQMVRQHLITAVAPDGTHRVASQGGLLVHAETLDCGQGSSIGISNTSSEDLAKSDAGLCSTTGLARMETRDELVVDFFA